MDIPLDVYCDAVQISVSPFDVALYLSQRTSPFGSTSPPKQVGCVRLSLEHAKMLSILLRRTLKCHEDSQGCPIAIHPQARQGAGISLEEDW